MTLFSRAQRGLHSEGSKGGRRATLRTGASAAKEAGSKGDRVQEETAGKSTLHLLGGGRPPLHLVLPKLCPGAPPHPVSVTPHIPGNPYPPPASGPDKQRPTAHCCTHVPWAPPVQSVTNQICRLLPPLSPPRVPNSMSCSTLSSRPPNIPLLPALPWEPLEPTPSQTQPLPSSDPPKLQYHTAVPTERPDCTTPQSPSAGRF